MKQQKLQYLGFVIIGFGVYMSYYSLVAQANYWNYYYDQEFTAVVSTAHFIGELCGCGLTIPLEKRVTYKKVATAHIIISFVVIVSLVPIGLIKGYWIKVILTVIPIFILGINNCIFSGFSISLSAQIATEFTGAIQVGIAVASVVITLLQDVVTLAFNTPSSSSFYGLSLIYNAIVYWTITLIFVITAIIIFFKQVNFLENKLSKDEMSKNQIVTSQYTDQIQLSVEKNTDQTESAIQFDMYSRKWVHLMGIATCVNCIIHYTLFPLFVLKVPSTNIKNQDWWILGILTIQCMADFVGRILPKTKMYKYLTPKVELIICAFRFIFYILFPLMTLPIGHPIIQSDYFYVIVLLIFSISYGMVQTLGVMRYQDFCKNNWQLTRGGFIINIWLTTGLGISGFATLGLVFIFK